MVMGGSALVSPQSPWAASLIKLLIEHDDNACWAEDLALLTTCAHGYTERIDTMNTNAQLLVERIRAHPPG